MDSGHASSDAMSTTNPGVVCPPPPPPAASSRLPHPLVAPALRHVFACNTFLSAWSGACGVFVFFLWGRGLGGGGGGDN